MAWIPSLEYVLLVIQTRPFRLTQSFSGPVLFSEVQERLGVPEARITLLTPLSLHSQAFSRTFNTGEGIYMYHSPINIRLRDCADLCPTKRVKAVRQLVEDIVASAAGLRMTVRGARAIRKAIDSFHAASVSIERESFWQEVRALEARVDSLDPRQREYSENRRKKAEKLAEQKKADAAEVVGVIANTPGPGVQTPVESEIVPDAHAVYPPGNTPVYTEEKPVTGARPVEIDPWTALVHPNELIRLLKVQQTSRDSKSGAFISNEQMIEAALAGRPRTRQNLLRLQQILRDEQISGGLLAALVDCYLT